MSSFRYIIALSFSLHGVASVFSQVQPSTFPSMSNPQSARFPDQMFQLNSSFKTRQRYWVNVMYRDSSRESFVSRIYMDRRGHFVRADDSYPYTFSDSGAIAFAGETLFAEIMAVGRGLRRPDTVAAGDNLWLFPMVQGRLSVYRFNPERGSLDLLKREDGEYAVYDLENLEKAVSGNPLAARLVRIQRITEKAGAGMFIGGVLACLWSFSFPGWDLGVLDHPKNLVSEHGGLFAGGAFFVGISWVPGLAVRGFHLKAVREFNRSGEPSGGGS